MGGLLSKEPPKPEPLLPIPWREVEFRHEAYMKLQDEIKNYQPHPKASTTNILILGNVGSGKSSFLNSMFSELRREDFNGRIQSFQGVRPPAQTSVTQRLKCHKFNDKIKIFDTAGFELEKTVNATIILKKIIDGEVAEGSKFDDILETKIKMEGDQIHCVVLVLSLHNAENLDPALIQFYEGLIGMLTKTEMQPQTCKEPPPCFTVACRHSFVYHSPALRRTNCLLLQPNISNFDSSVQSTCCHFSASQFLCFCA
ncbi:interferon-induced protein 44-like isoform X2 [Acipenser ruthenus]|uniref:interferon-induced protein 44-like isoform X2 n=1 Tax=Acipenser ruthenus TaxID=7906 RepID=UPI00274101F1|nr:interferon-induced protein 44-like isoform X2 [Acipenser ruthenus]